MSSKTGQLHGRRPTSDVAAGLRARRKPMIGASGRRHLGEPGFFRRRLRAPFGRRLPASRWRSRPDRVERSAGAAHEVEVESGRCRAPPIGIDKQHPEVGDLGHRLARPTLAQQLAEGHHSAHLSPLLGDRGSDLSRGKPLAITSMLPIGSSGRCPPSLPRRGYLSRPAAATAAIASASPCLAPRSLTSAMVRPSRRRRRRGPCP